MTPHEHVLIIGGGVAGLALAAALDPRRVRVTVVEERPERAGAGTVLAMWRGGRRALASIGVGDRLRAASFPVEQGILRDASGRELLAVAPPALWFTPRAELIAALEAALPASSARRTELVDDPLALAARLGADLVVGADGVRSAVRRSTRSGSDPVVTDWVALRGHLPGPVTATATEWWGPDALFGTTPGPRGSAWFCTVRDRDRSTTVDLAAALATARERFAGWDPLTRSVIERVGGQADVQRILLAPRLATAAGPGHVLIGDAAHAMSPNLGRGANEALEDAVALARLIHRHGAKGAPRLFSRRRHLRGQVLRAASGLALTAATSRRLGPFREHLLRGAGALI